MTKTTDRDLTTEVAEILGDYANDFDVPGIVGELIQRDLVDLDRPVGWSGRLGAVNADVFWQIVAGHDRTAPARADS